MDLQFQDGNTPEQLIVVPVGDLDLYVSVSFANAVLQKIDDGFVKIVVDFGQTRYLDSSGVGTLIRLVQRLKETTGELRAASLGGMPRKVLEMSGIINLFKVYPDVESCLNSWT